LADVALVIDPGVGVHRFVAEVLESRAVEFVGSALSDNVDYAAARAPDFGRVAIGRDLKFEDRILAEAVRVAAGSGAASRLAEEHVVGIRAVDLQAVRSAALPAETDIASAGWIAHHAGREQREVEEVAAVDRQVGDRPFIGDGRGL